MLDMWVIFVNISLGIDPVIHEERKAPRMPSIAPCLIHSHDPSGGPVVRLGVSLLDDYLEFLSGRCRPNTVLAVAYDLKVFFSHRCHNSSPG